VLLYAHLFDGAVIGAAAPAIIAVQCDEGGNDRVYGSQDQITIVFDQNTSVTSGTTWNTSQVLTGMNPNIGAGLGSRLVGLWMTPSRLRITVLNATGVNPFLECSQLRFRVASAADIRDHRLRSMTSISQSTAGMTNGSFAITAAQGEGC